MIVEYARKLDLNYEKYFNSLPPDKKPSQLLFLVTERVADILINSIGFDLMRIFYEAQLKRTVDKANLLSDNRRLYGVYKQIIKLGVQQGEFKAEIDIDSIANHCIISFRGMAFEWCLRYPDFDLKEEILKHFDILLTGIKNCRSIGQDENQNSDSPL